MCTLLTIDRDSWSRQIETQIEADFRGNPHGSVLLTIDAAGNLSMLKAFSAAPILLLLRNTDWARFWLHQRFATQGIEALENAHGWSSNGWIYMHNGMLQAPEAELFSVDSQAIGLWLEEGIDAALARLKDEAFANVFFVADDGFYVVNRSENGRLFSDGKGNYSTNPVGYMTVPVEEGSYEHEVVIDDAAETVADWLDWRDRYRWDDEKDDADDFDGWTGPEHRKKS